MAPRQRRDQNPDSRIAFQTDSSRELAGDLLKHNSSPTMLMRQCFNLSSPWSQPLLLQERKKAVDKPWLKASTMRALSVQPGGPSQGYLPLSRSCL